MSLINVEHAPARQRLEKLGVFTWDIWTKEVSTFPWTYDEQEVCFFLEGSVEVTPDGGAPVAFGKGDLVTFKKGLKCVWNIKSPVKKHYLFG
jgi:uncharacterized cupin superfamily protein